MAWLPCALAARARPAWVISGSARMSCGCGVGTVEYGLGTAGCILGASSSSLGEIGASPLLHPPHVSRSIISPFFHLPPRLILLPIMHPYRCSSPGVPVSELRPCVTACCSSPPAEVCCCLSSLVSILAAMGNKVLEIVSHGRRYSCR
jgi:hypothetical protein